MKHYQPRIIAATIVIAGLCVVTAGCKLRQAQALQKGVEPRSAPIVCPTTGGEATAFRHIIIFLLDRSLSIRQGQEDQLAEIREDAARLAQRLPPASRLVVRFIGEQSYRDGERAMSGDVPNTPQPQQCQTFDYRCRREEQQRLARGRCVDDARLRLATAMRDLNPERVKNTDVWGAMAAAADILSGYPKSQKTVVVLSDLLDTVGLQMPKQLPGLVNARVLVRLVKNETPVTLEQHFSVFSARMAQWGATVQVLTPEGPVDETLFVPAPNAAPLLTVEQHAP